MINSLTIAISFCWKNQEEPKSLVNVLLIILIGILILIGGINMIRNGYGGIKTKRINFRFKPFMRRFKLYQGKTAQMIGCLSIFWGALALSLGVAFFVMFFDGISCTFR